MKHELGWRATVLPGGYSTPFYSVHQWTPSHWLGVHFVVRISCQSQTEGKSEILRELASWWNQSFKLQADTMPSVFCGSKALIPNQVLSSHLTSEIFPQEPSLIYLVPCRCGIALHLEMNPSSFIISITENWIRLSLLCLKPMKPVQSRYWSAIPAKWQDATLSLSIVCPPQ